MRPILGLDIGGANLKAAHSAGAAASAPFPLWKNPAGLAGALRELVRRLPTAEGWAVTMTGELCDCFGTKREGVAAILDAAARAAGPTPVQVWRTDGRLVSPDEARRTPLRTAAANWLALATFAGRLAPRGPALLLDMGSTTTDIIPLVDGVPVPQGRTDTERLQSGELVYTGIRRTPLCALLSDVAAEFFATTLDVYLVLGVLPEDPNERDTADGRPATRNLAHARLARMICGDLETTTEDERLRLAHRFHQRQHYLLDNALQCVAESLPALPETVILSGIGEPVTRILPVVESVRRVVSFREQFGPAISEAACAYALAVLAAER